MNNSWGFLGNPTKEQITEWQNMPFGHFRSMIENKVAPTNEYAVFVTERTSKLKTIVVKVQAHDYEEAISLVKKMDVTEMNWQVPTSTYHNVVTYEYSGGVKVNGQ